MDELERSDLGSESECEGRSSSDDEGGRILLSPNFVAVAELETAGDYEYKQIDIINLHGESNVADTKVYIGGVNPLDDGVAVNWQIDPNLKTLEFLGNSGMRVESPGIYAYLKLRISSNVLLSVQVTTL